jgi:tRNA(Ile)-lysidine synthase
VGYGPYIVAALPGEPHERAVSTRVDAEALGSQLTVRRRRNGDRMQPLGMQSEKKLQDLLVDAHVPRGRRDALPIFETERGIVWVGGVRIADWAKPREGRATVVLSYRVDAVGLEALPPLRP